ncbi:MAG TPA: hypothetical protein VH477_09475 [Bryobacteraceae bacterium]|jgi:TctA family transporter
MGLNVDNNTKTGSTANDALNQIKPSKGDVFKSVLGSVARGAANILLPGLGGVIGGGISSQLLGSAMPGLGTDVTQYLALQRQMQQEQITFETMSTVLKIRADSEMSSIHNMVLK